jgi:ATP-dependent RNA helicase HelY
MAVNLVPRWVAIVAREVLQTSFAQFQADRSVVGLAHEGAPGERRWHDYAEAMHCHLGDFREYAALRRHQISPTRRRKRGQGTRSAARKAEAALSLESLRIGDIIRIPDRPAGRLSPSSSTCPNRRTGTPGSHRPSRG